METPTPHEPTSSQPDIHFEPGIHDLTPDNVRITADKLYAGNLNSQGWNKEVAERIRSYAYDKPLVIAPDGLSASIDTMFAEAREPKQDHAHSWIYLPARPLRLSQDGSIYTIKGDFAPPGSVWNRNQDNMSFVTTLGSMMPENLALTATILGVMGVRNLSPKPAELPIPIMSPERNGQFSRRTLLKTGGVMGALYGLRLSPKLFAPTSSTTDQMEFWKTADTLLRTRIGRSTWLDGRTALMMAKTQDVARSMIIPEDPSQTQYAILTGSWHADMEQDLRDGDTRHSAIKIFAEELVDVGKELYAKASGISPNEVPAPAVNGLLDYLAIADVEKVQDPGGPDFDPAFYWGDKIDECFSKVGSIRSPQVESAIADLRPKAKTTNSKAPQAE